VNFLIVDDHPLVRRGVRQILEEAYSDAAVTETDRGEEAIEHVRRSPWDLVLMDLSLPGLSGMEAIERIARTRPGQRVLVVSMHAEDELAVRALKLGAAGYITKDHAAEELLGAIAHIMRGRRYVSPNMAELLADRIQGAENSPAHERLSSREFRVLCLVAEGRSLGEIASQLSISPKTVSTYRARVLEKMRLETNADLTRYCLAHRLVS
jgi:DNA-binding NarL/FixJ family response regulator